ncbi:MAG: glucose-1-phosphate cytidylyltransferase [Conexivisphaerales archaeon]
MKVVILAGGRGSRLSEETESKPKPMIEIGGRPIIWHIMKIYSHYGFNDFVICLGYKGYVIKEYFLNYFIYNNDFSIDIRNNKVDALGNNNEEWNVTLVDTGLDTMTGGRIKRVQKFIGDETFMLAYGDGVANIDIGRLLRFHRKHRKSLTITAVMPPGRFGSLKIGSNDMVNKFVEKPLGDGAWINGGFYVLEPDVFNYLTGDETIWERGPIEKLVKEHKVVAFKHEGFWKPMDTLRDKIELERLWQNGNPPWKVWEG